ncbi:hypothetical protein EX30DRAFT_141034 [Ascodesmis nigricans]|uniref:Uncharacterized protein n=1 Tax=Ascodesmis nigricans TaxID=341454 RepID=A0A4V3SJ67_9PEZI|nr:hypothetical protein EX30DRAFT_141034 [Ascodesmis nigricans]
MGWHKVSFCDCSCPMINTFLASFRRTSSTHHRHRSSLPSHITMSTASQPHTEELKSLSSGPDSQFSSLSTLVDSLSDDNSQFEVPPFLDTIHIDLPSFSPDDAANLIELFRLLSEDHGVLSITDLHITLSLNSTDSSPNSIDVNNLLLDMLYDAPARRPRFAGIEKFWFKAIGIKGDTLWKIVAGAREITVWWDENQMEESMNELWETLRDGRLMMIERLKVAVVEKNGGVTEEVQEKARTGLAEMEKKVGELRGRERFGIELAVNES